MSLWPIIELCSFPYLWLITGLVTRLTWRVPLLEQELFVLPEHLSSPQVFSGVHVTWSLVLCVCFVDSCLSFCTFLLTIVLSVLLRYMDSDYPFGIFKLFLWPIIELCFHYKPLTILYNIPKPCIIVFSLQTFDYFI